METNEKKIGEVTHFFAGPSAAVLKLSGALNVGDQIHIVGFTTDLTEKIDSMQIDHNSVQSAHPGDDVAILVKDRVREGDEVFLVDLNAPVASPTPVAPSASVSTPVMAAVSSAGSPAKAASAAKAVAKPKAKPKTKTKTKSKSKTKPKKAKPKKAKAKSKKAKPKAKAKSRPKAKPKKKSKR